MKTAFALILASLLLLGCVQEQALTQPTAANAVATPAPSPTPGVNGSFAAQGASPLPEEPTPQPSQAAAPTPEVPLAPLVGLSTITRSYDIESNEGPGTASIAKQRMTARLTGHFREWKLFGMDSGGFVDHRTYFLGDGTLEWSFFEWGYDSDGCDVTKESSGTEDLAPKGSDPNNAGLARTSGTITVYADGSYDGEISRRVNVTVKRVPTVQGSCLDPSSSPFEDFNIELYVQGTGGNKTIEGVFDETRPPDEANGIVKRVSKAGWTIQLP